MKPAVHQYEDKLLEFAYGELAGPEASAVEAHVTGCARCTQALTEIRTVRVTMGKLPQVEAPEAGLDSLFAYAEQAARRNAAGPAAAPTWWRKLMAPLAGVAALGLVAGVGFKVSQESGSELAPSPAAVALKNEYESERRGPSSPPPAVAEARPAELKEEEAQAGAAPGRAQQQELDGLADVKKGKREANKDLDSFDNAMDGQRLPATQALGGTQAPTNMYGETQAPEKNGRDLGSKLQQATKASQTRRAEPQAEEAKKQDKAEEKNALAKEAPAKDRQDMMRGGTNPKPPAAKPADAPAPEPVAAAAPPPPAPKGSLQWGVTKGGGSAKVTEENFGDDAPDTISAVGSGPTGSGVKSGKVAQKPAPKTLGLDVEQKSSRDEGATREEQRSAAVNVDRSLADARKARGAGESKQQIMLAQQAIDSGARGEQRAEALLHLCEGYDNLGLEERADAYCQALVREFPGSASAKRIATRRNAPQPAVRKKAAPAYSADEQADKASQPAEAPAAKH